ncbi:hypothetical protein [Halalkalicoccus salilacus]|uniref:hypothetical protein n=1 Tax=Halalkalicoccus TaxID=332246 RepID=UPI002F969F7C
MATTDSTSTDRTDTTTSNVYIHGTAPASVLRATGRSRRLRSTVSRIKRTLR